MYSIQPDTEVQMFSNSGTWHIFIPGKDTCLCQASFRKKDFNSNSLRVKRTVEEAVEKEDDGLIGSPSKHGMKTLRESLEQVRYS